MKEFIIQAREYGIRVAIGNWLIGFTKWFIGAKRIQITYKQCTCRGVVVHTYCPKHGVGRLR